MSLYRSVDHIYALFYASIDWRKIQGEAIDIMAMDKRPIVQISTVR